MYMYMYVHVRVYMCIYVCVCMCIYIYTYVNVHVHVSACACVYVCICMCIYVYTYMSTNYYIHASINVYNFSLHIRQEAQPKAPWMTTLLPALQHSAGSVAADSAPLAGSAAAAMHWACCPNRNRSAPRDKALEQILQPGPPKYPT